MLLIISLFLRLLIICRFISFPYHFEFMLCAIHTENCNLFVRIPNASLNVLNSGSERSSFSKHRCLYTILFLLLSLCLFATFR